LNNLLKRSITGLIFVIIIAGAIIIGPVFYLSVFLILLVLGMWEFYKLVKGENNKPQTILGIITGCILYFDFFLFFSNIYDQIVFISLIPLISGIFVIEIYRKQKNPLKNIALTLFGIIYISLPISLFHFFVYTGSDPVSYRFGFLLGCFILVWM